MKTAHSLSRGAVRSGGRLRALLESREDWLCERILAYARRQGYTRYTSTLAEAWRISVAGLSTALCDALDRFADVPELSPDEDATEDPIAAFGIMEAQRHRARGVELGMFLGLTKYYRQTYQDLIAEGGLGDDEPWCRRFVDRCFDRVELGFCGEWAAATHESHLDELQAANRHLVDEKNRYLTVFESLSPPVLLLNEGGAVEALNFAAARLFEHAEVPGAAYYGSGARIASVTWLSEELATMRASGAPEMVVEKGCAVDDRALQFEVHLKRMLDVSGKFVGITATLLDVTERTLADSTLRQAKEHAELLSRELERSMAQAQEASRAKSAFLASMSHEIRNPLSAVLGILELLRGTSLEAEPRELVERAQSSAASLLAILNDVLDISKIEAGRMELEAIELDLREVIEAPLDLLAPHAFGRGLALGYVVDADVPLAVRGDPLRLRQVLTNLLSNAVKFTPQGEVLVRVAVAARRGDDLTLRFEVSDTGIGVAEDRLDSLFHPFAQADASTSRHFGGSGLGLAIVRRLAELMGGEVGATSVPGHGSTFWFTAVLGAVDARVEARPDLDGLRLLIADARGGDAKVLGCWLDRWNVRHGVACNVEQALQQLSEAVACEDPYHSVVIGRLPAPWDEDALARRIHEDPALTPRVLRLSGSVAPPANEGELVLRRPIKPGQLLGRLRRLTRR